jgi:ABC-2 type transport system permease protein
MSANVNIDSNTGMSNTPSPEANVASAALATHVKPFYWSLRRELWENRSIYLAPLAVAVIVLISAFIGLLRASGSFPFHALVDVPPGQFRIAGLAMYFSIAGILAVTAAIVGWFYCLDALSGERRERSILFWRSLPVSDVTTVLSKVLVGMGLVPLVALIVGLALFIVLLLIASIVLMVNGGGGGQLLANAALGESLFVHIYAAVAAILWGAPLYAWAIFVSSWARRATFLWALMVPAAIALAEGLAFGTKHFVALISSRFESGFRYAFVESAQVMQSPENSAKFDPSRFPESLISLMDPARFLSQPGLWIGLVVAAAFIAAAIWMRRYREPL